MSQISRNSALFSLMLMEYAGERFEKTEKLEMDSFELCSDYFRIQKESRSLLRNNNMYEIYVFEKNNEGKKACTYASMLMHFAVRYESVDTIDTFFESLDKTAMTSWSLMALLRTTYSYRSRLSQWERLYEATYDQVVREGLNPRRELHGLNV